MGKTSVPVRTNSGRFARNVLLSLSGGALLAAVGATAAEAQDAGTASDGAGAANSGDATSVGNTSASSTRQGGTLTSDGGGIQVVEQGAGTANAGVGVADTGRNRAMGNESLNEASGTQDALGGQGSGRNNGTVGNTSNGSALVSSGDATAIGNQSVTRIDQSTDVTGGVGGILLLQNAAVVNGGVARADTGSNRGIGNTSQNTGVLDQLAEADAGLASNTGSATTASNGTAVIATGDAKAAGNKSDSAVLQSSSGAEGGGDDGDPDLLLIPQTALVINLGQADAATGGNLAIANDSTNDASLNNQQALASDGLELPGLATNTADVSADSDGHASITTGAADASGNESDTDVAQTADPSGIVLTTQLAAVLNAGQGQATTGGNGATGNISDNEAGGSQRARSLVNVAPIGTVAGVPIATNTAQVHARGDGTASIDTGAASAAGSHSTTTVDQNADGSVAGAGFALTTQVAAVGNVGAATARTGVNSAVGNESENDGFISQDASAASDLVDPAVVVTGQSIASNSLTGTSTSDGTARIRTGDAHAAGNHSDTDLDQDADSAVPGGGGVIATQLGVVANAGLADAGTGDNTATGNTSELDNASVVQDAKSLDNISFTVNAQAPAITATNTATHSIESDGTAHIDTGDASAAGNASSTSLDQTAEGDVEGLGFVLETQVAPVLNAGRAEADTGGNTATGNTAVHGEDEGELELTQDALLVSADFVAPVTVSATQPLIAANQARFATASDGTAEIASGDATAHGNVSSTELTQVDPATVKAGGAGAVVHTQVGLVVNAGDAEADTGDNTATGNDTFNFIDVFQEADVAVFQPDPLELTVLGGAISSNDADIESSSDGTARIGTGGALATGNVSNTRLGQVLHGSVSGMAVVVDTQAAAVVNLGDADATTGNSTATGNRSRNQIAAGNGQFASILRFDSPPTTSLVVGSLVAGNSLAGGGSSDGDALIRTGSATATGNSANTSLEQALGATADSGVVVFTQLGGVLNLGVADADTGTNEATGNVSNNYSEIEQSAIVPELPPVTTGQIARNGASATNQSAGAAAIGSGNARAAGNESTTAMAQQAAVEDGPVFATQVGTTANAGLGLADTGDNEATGNESFNTAILRQTATGLGLVTNQGEAANASGGTAQIGDPSSPTGDAHPDAPGRPGLPVTGGDVDQAAVLALLLLMAGVGLRRVSRAFPTSDSGH